MESKWVQATAQQSAGTCKMALESANWVIFHNYKEKEAFVTKKNYPTDTSKGESSTTHPLKSFRLSCFMFAQLSLSFPLSFATSLPSVPILVFSSFSLSSPFSFSISVVLFGSCWTYTSLRERRGVAVTRVCTLSLICSDHGFGAYLDK